MESVSCDSGFLLRRAVNEPLQTVAIRFRVSPSRISKIQRAIDNHPLSPQQQALFVKCKVKSSYLTPGKN
jgi:hypothetical protein